MTTPPSPARRPTTRDLHGESAVDDYGWLRNRDDPAVIAHLEAENAYTAAVLATTEELQERIFREIKDRVQETDLSVPARKGDHWYLSRTEEGEQYRVRSRRSGGPDGSEQVVLDENLLAGESGYFALGNYLISPDGRLAAYATDHAGSERYTLRVRVIDDGADLEDVVENTYYGLAWSADSRHLFYVRPNEAMRPWQVWRHELGTTPDDDVLVHQEDDERMFLSVAASRSGRFVILHAGSHATSEAWVIPSDDPEAAPRSVRPRVQDVEYTVEHQGDWLWMVLTEGYDDGTLLRIPTDDPGSWETVWPEVPGFKLRGSDGFAGHLVVWVREDGLATAVVLDPGTGSRRTLRADEPVSVIAPDTNLEYETTALRFRYESLATPATVYEEDMDTGERTLLKRTPVLGGYDPGDYVQVREWAEASDGARIPMSIIYRKGVERDGSAPGLVYGYGAYEHSIEPRFSHARVSLLDRGVVYAIAHVRGGGEMGRRWYERGKLGGKPNTFTDFVACAEHLVEHGFVARDRLAIRGGSAGGLTVGAALNLRPDLFAATVAEVPFVDVVNTMLDETLPLTVIEWEEWGNPALLDEYGWIRAYAPYENLQPAEYPPVFATAGINDPRVGFWEPAKWIARLRDTATGGGPFLLRTELGAGHGGRSGRYDAWRDEAEVMAFLVEYLGVGSR